MPVRVITEKRSTRTEGETGAGAGAPLKVRGDNGEYTTTRKKLVAWKKWLASPDGQAWQNDLSAKERGLRLQTQEFTE